MPKLHLKEIADAIGGILENGTDQNEGRRFSHYHFDTREITEPNTLFFALKTESGDGHRFVRQLADKPGTGAVVSINHDTSDLSIPLIRVEDPLKAAHRLAVYVRNTHRHIKYIGVTGSAGKTTTKEFIFQVLSHKYKAYRSYKNWNNWIGMPFSILNMSGQEEAAVFELAMSYPGIGEIDLLAGILRPDAAVILNVYPVHLEFLGTIENAAKAKSEILNHLASDDVGLINGDSGPLMKILKGASAPKGRKIYFGRTGTTNDIRLKEIIRKKDHTRMIVDFYGVETQFVTSLINHLHIENLFVAIIVAQHLGMKNVEIQEALTTIKPLSNRGQIEQRGDFTIIDETYNSNPEALKRTLDWIDKEFNDKHERIAIVGDMLELGKQEMKFHREVGQFFASLGFDRLVTVGKRALGIADGAREKGFDSGKIHSFDEAEAAGKYLKQVAAKGSVLLFKASRGIRLENAVREFLNE